MSGKPKKSDYQASAAEKASAGVAMQEKAFFDQNYAPLLRKMRDRSSDPSVSNTLRGRANADTAQALSATSYAGTQNINRAGDMAQAQIGQLAQANTSAKQIQNQMATNVLGTARGQAADAQTGMAQASRMSTSDALARAKNKELVANAKYSAAGQILGSLAMQGLDNMGTSYQAKDADGNPVGDPVKGSFFNPVGSDGQKVSGFRNRLGYSGFFGR